MSKRKTSKKPKMLSAAMTIAELEEWFEAQFEMTRQRLIRKRKAKSLPAPLPRKEQGNA